MPALLAAAAAAGGGAAAVPPQTQPSFGAKGGVPAVVTTSFGACCQHAEAALACLADGAAKNATRVKFGGNEGDFDEVRRRVKEATVEGLLSEGDSQDVNRLVEGAFASGVWPLWQVGENHYAVFEEQSRGTEHRWAHVRRDKLGPGGTPRRVSSDRDLMCKVRRSDSH